MREQTAQQNADGGKYTTASEADIEAYIAAARACPAMAYRDEAVMTIIQEECAPLLRGEGPGGGRREAHPVPREPLHDRTIRINRTEGTR